MRKTSFRWIVALLAAMSLVAAACGDDADTGNSGDASVDSGGEEDDSGAAEGDDADADDADAETDDTEASDDGEADATGCDAVDLSVVPDAPVNIRFGHGASDEQQLYLMALDPEAIGSQYNGTHYTVELTQYSPPDRLAAYQAGAMDAGTVSAPQLFSAVGNGLNIMAATSVAVVTGEGGFVFPYAAVEGGDYGPGDDLTGAVIGIIAPNTATEYWAKSAIHSMGLDPERDVSFVPVPVPNEEQSLRDGQVDIQFFVASFWGAAQVEGGLTVVFDALTGPGFDHELLDVFFDRDFVQENPAAYCAWRADYVTSNATFIAERDSFGQTLIDGGYEGAPTVELFSLRTPTGRSSDAAIDLAGVQLLMDDMFAIGFLPEDLEVVAEDLVMDGFSLTK